MASRLNKTRLAVRLGIARSSLYYLSKKQAPDEQSKQLIVSVMAGNPSYGHKRIAVALKMNKKKVLRLMQKFGLKPRIMRGKKLVKPSDRNQPVAEYSNIVYKICPLYANVAWAGDFTYLRYKGSFIYLATVIDLYTREIVGSAISAWHSAPLVKAAFDAAAKTRQCLPKYFHSDQGSEYQSETHTAQLKKHGVIVSMSKKSSPWQNGYQESFYSQFKLELEDINRFETSGHLAEEIYHQLHYYNTKRIHTAFNMSPQQFYERRQDRS